ncbi:MAG: redoxin domain-containing protein [Micrococcales bacterium]|nr:redoxin domain-containing protein [Micrococcales bacterium]
MSQLNTPVPPFAVKAVRKGVIEEVTRESLLGHWSVLFFYPADFSFICPTELFDLHEQGEELGRLGVDIYAISTDSVYCHQAWCEATPLIDQLEFPLIADQARVLSRAMDVLDEDSGMAQRATFVINPEGLIKSIEISDGPVARRADELVRRIRAAQFVAGGIGRLVKATWAGEVG